MLAGPAPTHIGQVERQARTSNAAGHLETMQQEQSLELLDGEELDQLAELQLASAQDPMQRLMLLQMQQLRLLTKQIAGRQPQDAIHAALGSGGENSSGSSAGIKGRLAREAYIKISKNLVNYAQTVEQNALQELGQVSDAASPGLSGEAIAVGEHEASHSGCLLPCCQGVGSRTGNREMQGHTTKLCGTDGPQRRPDWLVLAAHGFARAKLCCHSEECGEVRGPSRSAG